MSKVKIEENSRDNHLTTMFFDRCEDAISEADKQYRGLLFSVIFTILKNKEDTEECLDDVYLKIWGSIPPNRPNSFRAYAIKIARNTAMSILRKNCAQKRVPHGVIHSIDEFENETYEIDIDILGQSNKIGEIINTYLDRIDDRKMYIFMSRFYFDKPINEIAQKLNCSQSTVNKEIKQIKLELKLKLKEGGYTYE